MSGPAEHPIPSLSELRRVLQLRSSTPWPQWPAIRDAWTGFDQEAWLKGQMSDGVFKLFKHHAEEAAASAFHQKILNEVVPALLAIAEAALEASNIGGCKHASRLLEALATKVRP